MIHPLDALKIAGTRKLAKEYRQRLETATSMEMALDILLEAICTGSKRTENRIRQSLLLNHHMTRVQVDAALALPKKHF